MVSMKFLDSGGYISLLILVVEKLELFVNFNELVSVEIVKV